MEKIPTLPFYYNADIDKLKTFRKKQVAKEETKLKVDQTKEEKNNIPNYAYNCNFIF